MSMGGNAAPAPVERAPLRTHCGPSRLRRVGNVACGVALLAAGGLLSMAGVTSLATPLTTAGVHLTVQAAADRLMRTPLGRRLALSSPRTRELRHFAELGVSVVMAVAGTLLAVSGVPVLGTPLIVEAVELGVHAVSSLREDVDCLARQRSRTTVADLCA